MLAADAQLLPTVLGEHADLVARAIELHRSTVVALLVELGFDVNARNRITALHEAALRGDRSAVDLLLSLGADPTIVDTARLDPGRLGPPQRPRRPRRPPRSAIAAGRSETDPTLMGRDLPAYGRRS